MYDLIIAGAGPAGCTLALNLAGSGLNIAMVEKETFPRKKICGDALSGKVLNILRRLPEPIFQDFLKNVEKEPSRGIRFVSPNLKGLDLPFITDSITGYESPGYICRREIFDEFLFKKLSDYTNIKVFEGTKISAISVQKDFAEITTDKGELRSRIVAGADGVHSIVRSLISPGIPKSGYCVGIRSYYKNVAGLHPDNFIELIFLRELLPGYLWIFKGPAGLANVGLGMLQQQIVRKRINLSRLFLNLIRNHPYLSPRFANALPVGKPEAHTLPLGTFSMKRSGNRFLLLGDAAFLVDPFSGEGIGNAMASGECASQVIRKCFKKNSFTGTDLSEYDQKLQRRMGNELRISSMLQKLSRSPALFNFVINKANNNRKVRELLSGMFTNENLRSRLTRPSFYIRLMFR